MGKTLLGTSGRLDLYESIAMIDISRLRTGEGDNEF
jgi:hypothetical protein